jgi:hypothetical protein
MTIQNKGKGKTHKLTTAPNSLAALRRKSASRSSSRAKNTASALPSWTSCSAGHDGHTVQKEQLWKNQRGSVLLTLLGLGDKANGSDR